MRQVSRIDAWLNCEKKADEVKKMKRQLPKNVRQIGNVSDSSKIYVEDYVDTFFNQLCEKVDQGPVGAFLVGEKVQEEDEDYIYVYGAIQMQEVIQKGRDVFIDDNTWKNGCELCKEYFGDAEILGWFLTNAGQALEVNHNIMKVHQKLFSREKSIFVVKEAREKEEKYFVHKYKDLMECGGHYIYYERNVEMQNCMIATRKKTGMTPSEIIEDTVTKNFRGIIRDKMEKNEQKSHSKNMYALSAFLVLVVLVIGITMINNYDKMKGLQNSLEQLNKTDSEQEEAVETIGTIIQAKPEDEEVEKPKEIDSPAEQQEQIEEAEEPKQTQETSSEVTEETPQDVGQAEEPTQTQETSSEKEEGEVYTVQKGDTLATISKKIYGDSSHVEAICKMNGLEDGNLIFIGQKLLLP